MKALLHVFSGSAHPSKCVWSKYKTKRLQTARKSQIYEEAERGAGNQAEQMEECWVLSEPWTLFLELSTWSLTWLALRWAQRIKGGVSVVGQRLRDRLRNIRASVGSQFTVRSSGLHTESMSTTHDPSAPGKPASLTGDGCHGNRFYGNRWKAGRWLGRKSSELIKTDSGIVSSLFKTVVHSWQ